MTAARWAARGDHFEARAVNPAAMSSAVLRRRGRVVRAGDDQRRRGDGSAGRPQVHGRDGRAAACVAVRIGPLKFCQERCDDGRLGQRHSRGEPAAEDGT